MSTQTAENTQNPTPPANNELPPGRLEKFFELKANGTTARTEFMAGLTTFFATAFTILAIPTMIGGDNMSLRSAVFIAATLSAAAGTLMKAFFAKLPFVQAPGMGIGSYFAGTVMPAMAVLIGNPDLSRVEQYQMGLVLVLIAGVLFWLTSFWGIRQRIVAGIPHNIKIALGSGIGLFITFLGLRQSGLVVGSPGTFVTLVNFSEWTPVAHGAVLSAAGLLLIAVLAARKIKGAILIGIVATAIAAYVTGHTAMPESLSLNPAEQFSYFGEYSFFRLNFGALFDGGVTGAIVGTLIGMVLVFTLVNMLDAIGTISGIARAAGMVDEKGEAKNLHKALSADAAGTVVSGLFGTSSTTTVVSSASGIGEGGRTGLTSATTGVLFIAALFLAPFVGLIPMVATAPALIFVGCLMMANIKDVDFKDLTEAIPAFLTIAMMPLSFSIANGIAFGLISYIIIKALTGRWRQVSPVSLVIAALFVLQFVL